MEKTGPVVAHLFRKPIDFFSIERVFHQLEKEMEREITIRTWIAPETGVSPARLWRNVSSARAVKADVYHITGDVHYLVLGLRRRRTVLTIHDCVFLHRYTGYKRRILKWLLLDAPVRRASLVTTISEATRKDILGNTGCPPEKVVVIPNPIDDHLRYVPKTFSTAEPVLLFLGHTPNKNLLRTIPALEGIPCRLDIVGEPTAEAIALLEQYKLRYTLSSRLTGTQIAEKYAQADIVLFPSTFEGFGLPIVEGQKAGRVVVTSDLDPMREVAGGAACLVDPYSIPSIRAGVLRVIQDAAYREDLVRAGFRNIERYSTASIASQYVSWYRRLLDHPLK